MPNKSGEFGLIEMIRQRFADVDGHGCEGIGDDCAVIPVSDQESLVVTTDMLVEDVHFLRNKIPARLLGRKSLAVNLSDIAAMGATPFASFLAISLPSDVNDKWTDDFMEGYHQMSSEYNTALLGGDTTSSTGKITISVTAIGRVNNGSIKHRSGAHSTDRIFVTGILGESARGLQDILSNNTESLAAAIHNDPTPQVREGIWLGKQKAVNAMMDISDGIASDLLHILKASGKGAEVYIDKIQHNSSVKLAVTGGEDYKLLITAENSGADQLCRDFEAEFGYGLQHIGDVTDGNPEITYTDNGEILTPNWKGYTHF